MKKHLLLAVVVLVATQALVAQTVKWIKNPTNGHFYALTSQKDSWINAQKEAGKFGANLATVRNKGENDWLVKTFPSSSEVLWIGLNDIAKEGTFVWATGQALGHYTNWAEREPNNGGGNAEQDCVGLLGAGSGFWHDVECGIRGGLFGIMERIDAEFSTFGKGCGSASAPPRFSASTPPILGQNFVLEVKGFLPKAQFGQLFVGASNTIWSAINLPLPLGLIGMDRCNLYVSPDSALLIATDALGTSKTTFKVPVTVGLAGTTLFGQAWAPDPKANPLGVATTNAFKAVIGLSK